MLTTKGLLWAIAGTTLILLGVGTGSLAATLLGAALILHLALALVLLARPSLDISLSAKRDRVTEGDAFPVSLEIDNRSRRSMVLEWRLDLDPVFREGPEPVGGTIVLPGGRATERSLSPVPELHGPRSVGPVRVLIRDPAGLVAREIEAAREVPCLVLPRVEDLRSVPLRSRMVTPYIGVHEVQRPGDGFEFYALRSYEPGDSIRSINWRASARSSDMIVNQRLKESFAAVTVLVDGRAWEGAGIAKHAPWQRSARAAASLAFDFMQARDRVTFHVLRDELQTVRAQAPDRQRRTILELLASGDSSGHASLVSTVEDMVPSLRSRSLFIVATSLEAEPGLADVLRSLVARDIGVLLVTPGSRWPDDEDDPRVHAAMERRRQELAACQASGAAVVEVPPDQLLSPLLSEVVHA